MPDGSAGAIVHAFKYEGWWRLADELALRMSRLHWPAGMPNERTVVVPVPLSPTRRRERGYNQCELLGKGLAVRWQVPLWHNVLLRARHTHAQARLTPEQRSDNVAGAFRVAADPALLRGAHVMLVDDVVTTAATLNACADALSIAGARTISYITFGRARAASDAPT